uniref:Uncharacterized protein n=1 Tax=Phlebotomus papatasi TaxID=29031 RepID=A0A1B0D0Y5_PHLPP
MEYQNIVDNCRACQDDTQEESQILIFATALLADIYKETTSLDIHENDGLPKVLCFTCYNRLLEAYNFRKMCSATALHFQMIVSMDVPEDKYTPPEDDMDVQSKHTTLKDVILKDIKPDPDESDIANSLLRDIYRSPDREDSGSDISIISVDEKQPEAFYDLDDDTSLMSGKSLMTDKSRESSLGSQKLKKSYIPGTPGHLICSLCDASFHRKSRLKMHMRESHLGLKACECKSCGKDFSRRGFKEHMENYHGKVRRYPCPVTECKNQYDSEFGLNRHLKGAHDLENPKLPTNKVWVCEVCKKEFNEFSALKFHRKTHQVPTQSSGTNTEINGKKYVCTLCGHKNDTADNLRIHLMSSHVKEKVWSCDQCPYTARQQLSLKQHEKVVHQGVKDFHCMLCDGSFTRAEHLKVHMMRHEGIKKFVCPICGKNKVSASELRIHVNTHTKEKMWACDYCSYKSAFKKTLGRHVKLLHHGVRDFHCPHCDKSFGRADTLKNHVMIHTGERPHACNQCGKRFIQRISLRNHLKTHLKLKPMVNYN